MKPEAEAEYNPEAQPSSYSRIPDLVQKSLLSRPKDARRAQGELLHLVETSKYFDPVVIAASYIQNIIVQPGQEARRIKDGLGLLNNIVMQGTGQNEPSSKRAEISVKIGPETVAAAKSMEQNDRLIKKNRFILSLLPPSYEYLMGITSDIQKGAEQGKNLVTIVHIERPKNGSSFSLEPYNLWTDRVNELLLQVQGEPKKEVTSKICDGMIDLLKQEPEQGLPEREKLYARKHGEVSLEDMGQMEYPLSEENFDKITDFLVLAFSENALPLYDNDIAILYTLFSHQTIFDEITGHISIRNQNILAIINSWQENFVDQLLFGDDDRRKSQIKELLKKGAPNINITELIWDIPHHSRGDPSYWQESHHRYGTLDTFSSHPVTYRYLKEFLERNPDPVALTKYPDEVGREYLGEVVIPRLRERLIDLGVAEELKEKMIFLENYVKENPYSKTHLEAIKTVFKINAGDYFLDRLNEHTEEMEDITKAVWEEIYQKGVHFLPLSKGSEVIEFSSDSVPSLLGLRSIEFTTPDPQKGEVLIRFAFLNMTFMLLSTLDLKEEENMLHFKARIQEDNHGLYTILNLITTLTMSDLVTQEIDRREPRHGNLPTKTKWQEFIKWLKNPFSTFSKQSEKDIYQPLPRTRTQKDQDVISSIHKDFPQRRVSLHKRALSGAQDYWNIVGEYIDVFANNKEDERVRVLEEEVKNARKKLHRISKQKSVNLPPMFRLEIMEDPITSEELYLETWVVEHTSPKPTPEELASPLKLFKRYYKESSALAFLDQMKPWFIGQ